MIGYAMGLISERSNHPFLIGLFVIGAGFGLVGIAIGRTGGAGVASGFMIVYAMLSVAMGAFGYAVLLLSKSVSRLRRSTSGV